MFNKILYTILLLGFSIFATLAQKDTIQSDANTMKISTMQAIDQGGGGDDPPPSSCVRSISPTSLNFPYYQTHPSEGAIEVDTKFGCSWEVTSKPTWVHYTKSGRFLFFYCDPNPSTSSRTGVVKILDKILNVSQSGQITLPTASQITQIYECGRTILKPGIPPSGIEWWIQGTSCGTSRPSNNTNYPVINAGTYYVRARRTASGEWSQGCISINVNVQNNPTISVTASPGTINEGQSAQLTASGANSYTWSPATALSATIGSTVSATPAFSTQYTVTGTSQGCSASKSITIYKAILASISQSQNSLTAVASGGTGTFSYLWSTGASTKSIEPTNDGNYSVTVTDGSGRIKTSSYNFIKKQDYNQSYVRTLVPKKDYRPTTAPDFNNLNYSQWKVVTSYMDGFGRSSQTIASKASPSGMDIVSFTEYDELGRQSKSYLSYTANGNDMPGAYRTKAESEQQAFYSSHFGQGNYAFAKVEYDGSPMNIPKKQFQQGKDWDNKFKEVSINKIGNTERIFNCLVNSNNQLVYLRDYTSDQLIKTIVKDEDLREVTIYKDMEGREVLRKATVSGQEALTYSFYDFYGRLRYVIPPKAVPLLTAPPYDSEDAVIKDLCYYYEYNERHLLVKKQMPGTGYVSMEYDNLDRLIKTQDAEQRNRGEKSFVEYDFLGRTHATGIEDNQGNKQYQSFAYYDNYNALPAVYAFDATHAYYTQSTKVKGMATWGKTRVMDWEATSDMPEWIISVNYYDDLGRHIQTISNNHKKGIDVSSIKYLYDGTTIETKSTHRVAEPLAKADIVIKNKFEYSEQGYLWRQKEQINNENEVIVNELEYYETGQVKAKKIHSEDNGAKFAQIVNYQYNIKGWLTQINNPANLNGDLFGMKLEYTEGTNKEYNGNIASVSWASATYNDVKSYHFTYDGLGRLSNAAYTDNLSKDYSVAITYDLNGNIQTLNRQGRFANGSFGRIDQLDYSYKNGEKSNQLDRVDDVNAANNQNHGFTDLGAFAVNEYSYDSNGNMLSDANRQITQISYNSLNLPVEITFSGGLSTSLKNTYLAGGAKLRKENPDGKTDYIGSFIYVDDELKYIQTGGGRIVVDGTNFKRQYYLTDHLGNVRVTFDTQGRVLQEDSYYPFGMAQEGLDYVNNTLLDIENKNKYLYNGKEQDDLTKFFEYGFRDYDSQLGRWHVVDAMAELYLHESPYAYVGNNPINFRDFMGLTKTIAEIVQELWDNTPDDGVGSWSSGGGGGGGTFSYYSSLQDAYDAGAVPGLERNVHFGGASNASVGQNIRAFVRFMTGGNVAPAYLRVNWGIQPTPTYTYDQYIEYWENRHGIVMDQKRRDILTAGCVGVVFVELGYAIKDKRHGEKLVPPLEDAFKEFKDAKRLRDEKQGLLSPLIESMGFRYIVYGIKFHTWYGHKYLPDNNGRIDMSKWDPYKEARSKSDIPFDFGYYDDETNTIFDANQSGREGIGLIRINQITVGQFDTQYMSSSGFNRIVYVVALARPRYY